MFFPHRTSKQHLWQAQYLFPFIAKYESNKNYRHQKQKIFSARVVAHELTKRFASSEERARRHCASGQRSMAEASDEEWDDRAEQLFIAALKGLVQHVRRLL